METTKKNKILVVDDNTENIRVIGSILRNKDYQVGFATRGQQALDILEEDVDQYDLVLLDVNMPGLSGFDVCKKIRENLRLKELPVIFLTANGESEHVIEGFASGGQDYVTKPFHAGELLSRIDTHIELKEKREYLQKINNILEEKVKERTRELEDSNKKLEAAIKELEKVDVAKTEFLNLLSHELNTPISGIIAFANLLKDELGSTEQVSFVDYLIESALRLKDFAQSSLVFTGIRSFPEKYKKTAVDIGKIMDEVLALQINPMDQKKIRHHYNCTSIFPIINGNLELIKICLLNILRNAVHYTPQGQWINIDIWDHNENLMVSIQDSGPGFSENAIHNIFKPFSPGEKHIDNNKGLGLFVVKMIIDFHHAQINISNENNSGARVVLSFNQVEK